MFIDMDELYAIRNMSAIAARDTIVFVENLPGPFGSQFLFSSLFSSLVSVLGLTFGGTT